MNSFFNFKTTSASTIFLFCNFVSSLVLLLAIVSGIYKLNISTEFEEYGLITTYSTILLLVISLVNAAIYIQQRKQQAQGNIIWLLIAMGFLFLALDEKFMIHENIDFFIHDALNLKETKFTDRIDDIIILLYGLIGLSFMIKNRHQFIRNKTGLGIIICGGAMMVASGVLDIITNEGHFASYITDNPKKIEALIHIGFIAEEVAKIFSETIFIAGFLAYLKFYKFGQKPTNVSS